MLRKVAKSFFLGLIVLGFISLDESFLNFRNKSSASLGEALGIIFPNSDLERRITELEAENENLKLKIFNQTIGITDKIKVYSSYPFNDRREIAIAAGENKNIEEGDLVTFGDGLLVGKIIKVYSDLSIVKTIFDPDWKMPVRIGEKEVDALFNGGNELALTLIPKDSSVKPDDIVITASRDLSYGLGVGRIDTVQEIGATPFKNATLAPNFNFADLKDVKIRKILH